MTKNACFTINEIIKLLDDCEGQIVFEDDVYLRTVYRITLTSNVYIRVIADTIKDEGLSCYYCSFVSDVNLQLQLKFSWPPHSIFDRDYGHFSEMHEGSVLWLPVHPISRFYNDRGHILYVTEPILQQTDHETVFCFEVGGDSNTCVECPLIRFKQNPDAFYEQIIKPQSIETKRIIRNRWFTYSKIQDTWKFLLRGDIFNSEYAEAKIGWPAQNLAFTLYFYLLFLYDQTNKKIYRLLCDMIAYSLLISLPENYLWRNGHWTQLEETHCRHQVSGIFVMLSHFQLTKNPLFLEKAECASDRLLELCDKLPGDSIWFFHDSLELNQESSDLYYKRHLHTDAFGKSRSNTLCLNTHIWTQILLYRLYSITGNNRYLTLAQKSIKALKKVLSYTPGGFFYGPVYFIRDFIINCSSKTNFNICYKVLLRYEKFLKETVMPVLKRKFPRFIMPNGFSERDLDHSAFSNSYHVLNVKDMLMLYRQSKEDWLKDAILKILKHLRKSSHIKWMYRKDVSATMILDVYLLAAGLLGEEYVYDFVAWLDYFRKQETFFTMDILSNPMVCGCALKPIIEDSRIIQFSLPTFDNSKILLVNLGNESLKLEAGSFSSQAIKYIQKMRAEKINRDDYSTISLGPYEWVLLSLEKPDYDSDLPVYC